MHETCLHISSEGTSRFCGRSFTLASMCFLFTFRISNCTRVLQKYVDFCHNLSLERKMESRSTLNCVVYDIHTVDRIALPKLYISYKSIACNSTPRVSVRRLLRVYVRGSELIIELKRILRSQTGWMPGYFSQRLKTGGLNSKKLF